MRIELWLGGGDDGLVLVEDAAIIGSEPSFVIQVVGRKGDGQPIDTIHLERHLDRVDLIRLGRACLLFAGAAVPPQNG